MRSAAPYAMRCSACLSRSATGSSSAPSAEELDALGLSARRQGLPGVSASAHRRAVRAGPNRAQDRTRLYGVLVRHVGERHARAGPRAPRPDDQRDRTRCRRHADRSLGRPRGISTQPRAAACVSRVPRGSVARAARGALRRALQDLGFAVAPETRALMREIVASGEIEALRPERIWQETSKALRRGAGPTSTSRCCETAARSRGCSREVDALFGVPQPERWHPEIDTGVHTLLALNLRGAAVAQRDGELRRADARSRQGHDSEAAAAAASRARAAVCAAPRAALRAAPRAEPVSRSREARRAATTARVHRAAELKPADDLEAHRGCRRAAATRAVRGIAARLRGGRARAPRSRGRAYRRPSVAARAACRPRRSTRAACGRESKVEGEALGQAAAAPSGSRRSRHGARREISAP